MAAENNSIPKLSLRDENSDTTRLLSPSEANDYSSSSYQYSSRYGCTNKENGQRFASWKPPTSLQIEFLSYILSTDVKGATDFLNKYQEFDINEKIDIDGNGGMTPLCLAVSKANETMVRFLLSISCIDVADSTLVAARDGLTEIVNILLDHICYHHGRSMEDSGCTDSERFPEDVTPLMLAAIHGHVGLMRQLLNRGHNITIPHLPNCNCEEKCKFDISRQRKLQVSYERVRAYTVLTRPAYLMIFVRDPVLRAFQLYRDLQTCAIQDAALASAYEKLMKDIKDLLVHLLDCCRTDYEVNVLLCEEQGFASAHKDVSMPRLLLAIEDHQKEFVAHPSTQHVLYGKWLGDSRSWSNTPFAYCVTAVLLRIPSLPVLAIINAALPFLSWSKQMSSPVNRLVNHVAGYIVFLVLVFVLSNLKKQKDGPNNTGLEWALVVYLAGYECNLCRLMWLQRPRWFFNQLWNCYDVVMLHLFWIWFGFWLYAVLHPGSMERKFWSPWHPALVSEAFFATAAILAFGRLLFLCQLHPQLGPMQVSLGKIVNDVVQCAVVFVIILLAFAAGLGTLYQYYENMLYEEPDTGMKVYQPSSFVDFVSTLKTLFWGLFGLTPPEYTAVVIENLPEARGPNVHTLTQSVGSLAFGLYMLLSSVLILNVLVAKMTNTYQKVVDNVDIEWTFRKTEIFVTYMQQTVMPPPFNLIPTLEGMSSFFYWITRRTSTKRKIDEEDDELETDEGSSYSRLIDILCERYLATKHEHRADATESVPDSEQQTPRSTFTCHSDSKSSATAPSSQTQAMICDIMLAQIMPALKQEISSLKEEIVKELRSKSKR